MQPVSYSFSRKQILLILIFILNVQLNINWCALIAWYSKCLLKTEVFCSLVYLNRYGYLLYAGLSVTAEQINPHGSAVRKTEARVEETFRNKQKPTMAVWPNSATKCACEYFGWWLCKITGTSSGRRFMCLYYCLLGCFQR